MKLRLPSSRLVAPTVLLMLLAGVTAFLGLGPADADDSVTVSHDGFDLTCPSLIAEGSTLTCTLTNTAATEEDWPVVGILHRSDDSNRALVRGSPLDVQLSAPTPEAAIEGGLWWIGPDLVGYSFFDWSGTATAAPGATATTSGATTSPRQVVISILDDGDYEEEEVFYVSLASDGSRNVGVLYNNRQRVRISDDDSKSGDSSLSGLRVFTGGEELPLTFSSTVLSYQITVDYDVTEVTLIPEVAHERATVTVNGVQAASGAESAAVHLASGSTPIAVLATAENGTSQTYTVAVSRGSRTENVEVGVGRFTLSCPSLAVEGSTLACTLTNTGGVAAPWPVVAIIHSSADANRALITEDSKIASTQSSYRVDLEFAESQAPERENYNYGYGELFSGGSMSVYTVYGYEKFDWSGEAAAGASRTVSIDIKSDDVSENEDGEVFFVALAASDSTGLSGLVDNKAPIVIVDLEPTDPDPEPTAPGAPTITSVVPGARSLTVEWTAPADNGGGEVTSYDARYIETSADETVDINWTVEQAWTSGGGDLRHTITGLVTGTRYDVEVRAVNSVDGGAWSAEESATTSLSGDATLRALALTGSTLYPSFASGTRSYKASTGHADGLVTVAATASDANASVAFRDGDGNSLTDAGSAAGFQVGLSVGVNVIKVQVAAEDGVATETYTISVTRAAQDLSLSPPASDPATVEESAAAYTVTFEGRWTSDATPGGVPGDAHFSRLIGAVHNAGATFLESGGTASVGVESMAETGENSTLSNEVSQQIDADPPGALSVLSGSTDSIGPTATRTLSNVIVTTEHPRVTLTTMVAPSPDWFVGVAGLLLLDAQDAWIESLTMNLYPWDAGTEDGTGFSLGNDATVPQGVITSISGTGPFSAEPIAALTFARESISTPPRFPAAETGERSIPENTPQNRSIGDPVAAEDPDGGSLAYTLSGPGARLFGIVGSSGQLRTKGALNHEAASQWSVTVTVVDPYGLSDSIDVTVTVTDVNEPPTVSGPPSANFDENAVTEVASYDATDPDNDVVVWSLGGVDAGHFEVGTSGELRFAEPPDFEARGDAGGNNVYNVTVIATDRDLSHPAGLKDEVAVAVTLRDVNEVPVVSGPSSVDYGENAAVEVADYDATDPENDNIGWSLAGTDREDFTVSAAGVLSFASRPDFEDPDDADGDNEYHVTVVASDGRDGTDEHGVTVTVGNVDEPGVVGLSSAPQAGTEVTAALSDPDGSVRNVSWSWQRSQDRSSWSEISGAAASGYTPSVDDVGFYLRASVSYDDGAGTGKSAEGASDERTAAEPVTNTPPEFPGGDAARSVAENSPAGTAVGAPVAASDPDDGDTLSYTLADGAGSFTIDRAGGQIRVGDGAMLNHEDRSSYQVTVTATDRSATSASILVDIAVTDVDEPPEAVDDRATVVEDTPGTIDVLANDTDPEGEDLTIRVSVPPRNGTAAVGADNTVTYTPDADYDGIDTFTYRISDGFHSDVATVRVIVVPVNDAPMFGSAVAQRTVPAAAAAGTPVGAPVTADDVDGDTLTYALSGTDAALFDIDRHRAQITVGAALTAAATYRVTVTATDPANATATIEVTITTTGNTGGGGGGAGGAGGGGGGGGGSGGGGGGGGGALPPEPVEAPVEEPVEPPEAGRDYFVDDDGLVHEDAINRVAAAGITVGCGDGVFCPSQPVTRAQMATFLTRALKLPEAGRDYFVDDDGLVHEDAINRVAAAGITVGCGDGVFCPSQPVTRAQMATFLTRALKLPEAGRDYFVDDDGLVHEDAINRVAAAGITVGCGDGVFCPSQPVTRAQMATFLTRALKL